MTTAWLPHTPSVTGATARVFCFPYAGGGASTYRTWAEPAAAGPARLEIWPVQLPGRENRLREPAVRDMADLMPALFDALAPHLADLPYACYGHSLGADIAFEFSRRAVRAGLPAPVRLFVAAHRPPHLPDPKPPAHALPEPAFLSRLTEYGDLPDALRHNRELLDLVLPSLRADFALFENYRLPEAQPAPCPITAFAGEADRSVTPAALRAWSDLTSAGFRLRSVPGGHFFLRDNSDWLVATLGADLRADLARRTAGSVMEAPGWR
jgi:surfactin synthase thioesterase subunit